MNFILAIVSVVACLIQQQTLLIEAMNVDLLNRIHQNNYYNSMQQSRTISFLQHVVGFDSTAVCPSLLRSDVQVRLNSFRTIVSSCSHGFTQCRLAMSVRGQIYGTTNPEFNSNFTLLCWSTKKFQSLTKYLFSFNSLFKPDRS